MGCPVTPLSCLEPENIFAGVYNPHCAGFADPSKFQAEQALFKSYFEEQINNYGVDINYYLNGFELSAMTGIYGEHPTQEYSNPFVTKAYIELEEGISLSQFGYDASDELTIYITIDGFVESLYTYTISEGGLFFTTATGQHIITEDDMSKFLDDRGLRYEPKSDDLIEVTALGCDRPGDRGAKIFIITEVLDQSVQDGINPMMGHYVWKITAKRYESSGETNAPQELGDDQVYDNDMTGKESSTIFPALTADPKVYDYDVDEDSKDNVFDMSKNDTSIYGDYY